MRVHPQMPGSYWAEHKLQILFWIAMLLTFIVLHARSAF